MFVRTINIRREGDYGYGNLDLSKPMLATIEVAGQHGKVELKLSPELSARVVAIIAEEIASAGRATAEALTADILQHSALPSPQEEAF